MEDRSDGVFGTPSSFKWRCSTHQRDDDDDDVRRSVCAYERCAAAAVNIGFAYAQGSQCGSNRLNVVVPTTNCREVYRLWDRSE